MPLEIQFRMKTTRQINNGIAGGTQADHLKFQGESGGLMMTLAAGIFLAALPSAARQVGSDRAALVKEAGI